MAFAPPYHLCTEQSAHLVMGAGRWMGEGEGGGRTLKSALSEYAGSTRSSCVKCGFSRCRKASNVPHSTLDARRAYAPVSHGAMKKRALVRGTLKTYVTSAAGSHAA